MTEKSDSGQPLPGPLAAGLTAKDLAALRHPYRRQILRVLQRDVQRLSPVELTESGLLPCSLSAAAYHLTVLENAGLVREVGAVPSGAAVLRFFSSRVEQGTTVAEILRETDEADRTRLAAGPS